MSTLLHKKLSRWACGLDFGFGVTFFGYQLSFSFDLTDWYLMMEHYEGVGYLICVGPFTLDILDATKYSGTVDPEVQKLQDELFDAHKEMARYYSDLEETKKALEQETVRLAACGVAALGYGEKLEPEVYGYSASYEDAYNLRIKYNQALKEIEKLRKKLGIGGKNVKGKDKPTRKSRRKS